MLKLLSIFSFQKSAMKKFRLLILFFLSLFCFSVLHAQQTTTNAPAAKVEMKQYFFVMLTKGNNRNQDSTTAARIQDAHIKNIERLAGLGKILVAGPFGDEGEWRGIFIFDCSTRDEVETYLKTDPAIAAGRLAYDIKSWWTAKNCIFK